MEAGFYRPELDTIMTPRRLSRTPRSRPPTDHDQALWSILDTDWWQRGVTLAAKANLASVH